MSRYYDKDKLKDQLESGQVYDLLEAWGGEPEEVDGGFVSQTICHNLPGEGSRKLYYYYNTRLFRCYTGCVDPTFDIFDLCIKVMKKQKGLEWELWDAMDYIASYFGFNGEESNDSNETDLRHWEVIRRHGDSSKEQRLVTQLPEYNPIILTRFSYPRIKNWENEGISPEIARKNVIGYYAGGDQITIPHFDINGRLIGIRGRYLAADLADRYGKYRPLVVNKTQYNHPLSMNLYNLNNSKENIAKMKTAIVFEGEKSALKYQSYYGRENDISVAVCGSSLSAQHVKFLRALGVTEIIIAFDRQFQGIGDKEFQRLKSKLIYLYNKYGKIIKVSFIFDKKMITGYKASPLDEGTEKFERLLKERIVL